MITFDCGMVNPQSESSQIPLRKRLRFQLRFGLRNFLGKHACVEKKKSGKRRRRDVSPKISGGYASYLGRGGVTLAEFMRSDRKTDASRFRNDYYFGDSMEERVYINYEGDDYTWKDRSAGCSWVAVYGKDSMCVALKGTLEMVRFRLISQFDNGHILFASNVVSEIEDIAMSNEDSHQTMDKHVKKPFAVVNIASVHQESGFESSGAIAFLKERISSGLAFTREETIQTAISALVRVFSNKELKAVEIWGCMLENDAMHFLQQAKLQQQLAIIKKSLQIDETEKPDNGGSGSSVLRV